jgi:hypothetical protein
MADDREYYVPGLFNIYCMSCGRKYKSNEIRKRWDGLLVCEEDWEMRHPQDFVRGVQEKSNILPFAFDTDGSEKITGVCTLWNSVGLSGVGVAGCAVAGVLSHYEDATSGTPYYLDGTSGAIFASADTPAVPGANTSMAPNNAGMPTSLIPSTSGTTTIPFTPPPPPDPYTLALLHLNGTNGSTTITDATTGTTGNTWTSYLNGVINTGDFQFPTASYNCNWTAGGNSGYVSESHSGSPAHALYGLLALANVTWECWAKITSYDSGHYLFSKGDNAGAGNLEWVSLVNNVGTFLFNAYDTAGSARVNLGGGTVSLNTWHHFAVVKQGTTWTMYLDGTQVSQVSAIPAGWTLNAGTQLATWGYSNVSYYYMWAGSFDECRISSTARYTSNFTPTGPFTL